MAKSSRAVVIGAGINGLVAAHYLRRAGWTVTVLERADRVGGACISAQATIDGQTQLYALGASVLGLMPDFIFRDTGLSQRLTTFVPSHAKRVYFADRRHAAWIHRDAVKLDAELARVWNERGDVAGFRADEGRVVEYLREGYRTGTPPNLTTARQQLGDTLCKLWIQGSARNLLDHYFTGERTKVYMAMTVTESGPVSLSEPYSAFTIPLMDSGSVFDGYYGFVAPGLWRLLEELGAINHELGVDIRLGATVERVDPDRGQVHYRQAGETRVDAADRIVFATDPVSAARLVGDGALLAATEGKRMLGTSGKLVLFFRRPARWKDEAATPDGDAAFRFVFSVETLAEFEQATMTVTNGTTDYAPGYAQVYCEGAAMRRVGVREPFDRLSVFFKNVAFGKPAAELAEVAAHVRGLVSGQLANPTDCVHTKMLAPRDLKDLFLFPAGNLDHTMLVAGQTFADRRFGESELPFYQFGRWANLAYCGAGAYPCGSIAGTPGFLCANQLIRSSPR